MTATIIDKILSNVLGLFFALCGLACIFFAFATFEEAETIMQEIAALELLMASATYLGVAMLCGMMTRMASHAARERRIIELLEDIEAELTRQGKSG